MQQIRNARSVDRIGPEWHARPEPRDASDDRYLPAMRSQVPAQTFPTLRSVQRWSIERCVHQYDIACLYYEGLSPGQRVAVDLAVRRQVELIDDDRAIRTQPKDRTVRIGA